MNGSLSIAPKKGVHFRYLRLTPVDHVLQQVSITEQSRRHLSLLEKRGLRLPISIISEIMILLPGFNSVYSRLLQNAVGVLERDVIWFAIFKVASGLVRFRSCSNE